MFLLVSLYCDTAKAMACSRLVTKQTFERFQLPFKDQMKIKQELLKGIFSLVIKISPEYLPRFSKHLNGRTHVSTGEKIYSI